LKILFVHEVSYIKKPVYEIHEFPEYLATRGHDVSFFEFDEGRRFWNQESAINANSSTGKVVPGARIKLFRPFQIGAPGVDRILAVFSSFPKLSQLFRKEKFDVVVLYAIPTYGAQVIYLARRYGVPVVFRALDVSHKIRASILSPLIKSVEKHVYKNANLLSVNNPAMAKYCLNVSSRKDGAEVHFPPLDLEHFANHSSDASLRLQLGISKDDHVIVYMGSFFYFSGLPNAIKEFARHSGASPTSKLLLIGMGEQDPELRKLVKDLSLENRVLFAGFVPYKELPRYLSSCDIAVNTLEPTLVSHAAFPNKVLQYLASGLPVVSTRLDGLEGVFGDHQVIEWASSPEEVIATAMKSNQKPGGAKPKQGNKNPTTLVDLFSPSSTVDKFESALKSIIEREIRR
jgi:glycosyltransferase involved in cell wall biosynthesis